MKRTVWLALVLLPLACATGAPGDRRSRPLTSRELTAQHLEQRDEATRAYLESSAATEARRRGPSVKKTVVSEVDGRTYVITTQGEQVLDMGWSGAE